MKTRCPVCAKLVSGSGYPPDHSTTCRQVASMVYTSSEDGVRAVKACADAEVLQKAWFIEDRTTRRRTLTRAFIRRLAALNDV